MEIPHVSSAPRSHSIPTLPSIRIHDPNPLGEHHHLAFRGSGRNSLGSGPMSIPNAKEPVPPALPPPRQIDGLDDGCRSGADLGWWLGNSEHGPFGGRSNFGAVDPKSSLQGSQAHRGLHHDDPEDLDSRRSSSTSITRLPATKAFHSARLRDADEGYASLSSSGTVNIKSELQGEESQTNAFLQRSVQAYDNSLLQKIDLARSDATMRNSNTPPRNYQPSAFRASGSDTPTGSSLPFERRRLGSQLKPLSLPSTSPTTSSGLRSGAETPDTAVSPHHKPYDYSVQGYVDYRTPRRDTGSAPSSAQEFDHNTTGQDNVVRRSGSTSLLSSYDDGSSIASRSNRGSYDQGIFSEPESDFPMEETGLRHLNIGDQTPPRREEYSPGSRIGQKRRASSPPRDPEGRLSLSVGGGAGDMYPRQTSGHRSAERKSSVPRLNNGSVSSTSSVPRNGSLASSAGISLAASSTTSMSSYERLSPRGSSPASEMDPAHDSLYVNAASLRPSPRGSMSKAQQRAPSESKSASSTRKSSTDDTGPAKTHGMPKSHFCECCPKKPKKFDNLTELRTHEMEKQYTCQYCHNRFKNKNEAERHQNSLHLRRHSWSCNALSGVEAAFHPSPNRPSAVDVCGYCGQEFPNPANWDVRVDHLTTLHKFGECNQGKKFFRADHFRQHLKHSHAGTSGKWTNMLENACMKDEPLPERVGSVSEGVGRIDEEREEV